MREIKTRVHCKATGRILAYEYFNTNLNWGYYWLSAEELKKEGGSAICHAPPEYFKHPDPMGEVIRVLFTGLKDSNGVEIYEGDVVTFTYWWFDGNIAETQLTGTIIYSDQCMSFQLKGVKNDDWEKHTGYVGDDQYLTPFSELNFDDADFEVIGNIHETHKG